MTYKYTPQPDVVCPYCGEGQEICHDDGLGYEEDRIHEQECGKCEKIFVFTTSISFYYEANKADCLNGEEHKRKSMPSIPFYPKRTVCEDCGEEVMGEVDQEAIKAMEDRRDQKRKQRGLQSDS